MSNQKKKKILFLITKSNWGGAQRYVFDLATAFKTQFDVVVALGGDGALKELLEQDGIRTISIPGLQRDLSLTKELTSFRAISHIIRTERPDVLHVNSSKAGGIGALLGRIHRVPRIMFTAHAWAFNEDRPAVEKLILSFLHFLTIMLAHQTIAVSSGLKREMRWPWTKKRMVVIHPGRHVGHMLDRESSRNEIIQCVPSLQKFQQDTWVGTVAELHPTKRLDVAIGAMTDIIRSHPRTRYILIGSGEQRDELEKEVRAHGLREHVFFTGPIRDAARVMRAFDLFVLPSRSESFGYVLLEAGYASLPVVATEVGGIPDIITNGENGTLIQPHSTEALAHAVLQYLNDPPLAAKHAEALHTRVAHFSITRMVEETRKLYCNT